MAEKQEELYKKYRPRKFKDILGQDSTVTKLLTHLKKGNLPHAMIFTGPSGCGKTTLARVLALKLDCGQADLKEINGASSRGIDEIRSIEKHMYSAPMQGKTRMWILDEAHKLTNDAQNALLKPLEDTPSHVYFCICTTNPGKLIATIRNRCSPFPVKALTPDNVRELVTTVAKAEGKELAEEVTDKLVANANGSARWALVLLESVLSIEDKAKQLQAIVLPEEEQEAFDLARMLLWGRNVKWKEVAEFLKELKKDHEEMRHLLLAIATTEMLKANANAGRAYKIVNAFRDPYYDCGKAGLVASCWEALHG